MSAATKGNERAAFIDQFLSEVMPRPYRFGTGDITDANSARSGEIDVVVEFPFSPSLPLGSGSSRLYLAEGVAAAIEIKSDVAGQWNEALNTSAQLNALDRSFGMTMTVGNGPNTKIPLFVVGYTGWKQVATVQQHMARNPAVAGVLVIDSGIFVSGPDYGSIVATGPWALWGMIGSLYRCVIAIQAAVNDPLRYAV